MGGITLPCLGSLGSIQGSEHLRIYCTPPRTRAGASSSRFDRSSKVSFPHSLQFTQVASTTLHSMDRFTIDPPLVAPPVDGLMDVEGLVDFKITSTEIDIHITRNFLAQLDLDLDPDLDILSYDYDKLKMHLRSEKQIQYERNYRSNNDLALLDLDLEIDLDHDVDLLSYACGKLVKRSRSEKQIQYERNYRSNQKVCAICIP